VRGEDLERETGLEPACRQLVPRPLLGKRSSSSEQGEKALREKSRLEEKLRRLRRQFREGETGEDEYRHERQITEAAMAALQAAEEEPAIQVGDWAEDMVDAWSNATKE
jgi:hypothetical protein